MQTNSPQTDVASSSVASKVLNNNQFGVNEAPSGSALLVGDTAVFAVAGNLCAPQAKCPPKQGPLNEGALDGSTVTCPWHGSQFNVCTGAVLRGPAVDPLRTYRITVEGEFGVVETR
jgi:nitrite reductase/ring-hydroxylating ferredoxin subunit